MFNNTLVYNTNFANTVNYNLNFIIALCIINSVEKINFLKKYSIMEYNYKHIDKNIQIEY